MFDIRRKDEHFRLRAGWLDARWHFSFSTYHDPQNLNFGPLRVFNDDLIEGESGFPLHPHWDMEIVTLVQGGVLSHYDTTGNSGEIRPGDVQKMSAGSGIRHSELNNGREPVRLQQIWFLPAQKGLRPSYAQDRYTVAPSGLTVVASPWAQAGGVPIYQDVVMALSERDQPLDYILPAGRGLYVYAISGDSAVAGEELRQGDAARITDRERLTLDGAGRVLIIDVPLAPGAPHSTLLTPVAGA